MSELRVWAPHAGKVEVETREGRSPMQPADGDWFTLGRSLPPDTDYAFVLDGGAPLPDPRSPRQPNGVHGASRTIDPSAFRWTDAGFRAPPLASAVLYELHVGTFTPEGTFEAVIPHLDELVALGITHVELLPVNSFPGGHGWGYDGVDLYAPHEPYGGPLGLKRLVDACHDRGLGVLLDVVYNHLGPDGNYLSQFGPYFTDFHPTPWGPSVNLDREESFEVRRFFVDNALMWLRDYHFDGLRIDAVHAFYDTSAVHLLEQMAIEVEALAAQTGRPLVLIAESDLNDPRIVRPRSLGGYGIDAQWSDDFHHALHAVLTEERSGYYEDFGSLADLAKTLAHAFVYDGKLSPHRRRAHGRPIEGVSPTAFLGYLQNHDQVGNRAKGERIGHLVSPGRAKIGAALYLTAPYVPMIFQGEEWSASSPFCYFVDHQNEDLRKAVREGRRREFAAFGWKPEEIPDPSDRATFERSKLDWSERENGEHRAMLDWYTKLLALRKQHPDLGVPRWENLRVRFDEKARWLVFERGNVRVACNLGTKAQPLLLGSGYRGSMLLASDDRARPQGERVELPADSVAIFG